MKHILETRLIPRTPDSLDVIQERLAESLIGIDGVMSLDIVSFPEIIDVGACVRGVELNTFHISSVGALGPDGSRIQFPQFPIRALD